MNGWFQVHDKTTNFQYWINVNCKKIIENNLIEKLKQYFWFYTSLYGFGKNCKIRQQAKKNFIYINAVSKKSGNNGTVHVINISSQISLGLSRHCTMKDGGH